MTNVKFFLEGNIGAGKSSVLCELFKRKPAWSFHDEPVDVWRNYHGINYLEKFYQDPVHFALPFQQIVLKTYEEAFAHTSTGIHVFARSPRSAVRIFGTAAESSGFISKLDLDRFEDSLINVFDDCNDFRRNFTFYLRTNPSVAYSRACLRTRAEEKGLLSLEYIERLHYLHENVFMADEKTRVIEDKSGNMSAAFVADNVIKEMEHCLEMNCII